MSIKMKKKNTALSGQFQNPVEKSQKDAKFIPLTHVYITTSKCETVKDFKNLV